MNEIKETIETSEIGVKKDSAWYKNRDKEFKARSASRMIYQTSAFKVEEINGVKSTKHVKVNTTPFRVR